MAEELDAYEQAERELTRQGRPKPQGDWLQGGLIGGGIALAAAVPLVLIIGRHDNGNAWDFDKMIMYIVVFGVAGAAFAIRYFRERIWWQDRSRRAQSIREELALVERRRGKRRGAAEG